MAKKSATANRIPAGEVESVRSWDVPNLTEAGVLDEILPTPEDEIEVEDDEVVPLTAEQLEEIRQAAYEDGHKEGQERGYQAGLKQGHDEGVKQGTVEGRQHGLQQGIEEGKKQGLTAAQEQIDQLQARLQELLSQLHQPIEQQQHELESALLNIVVQISETVLKRELQLDSSQIQAVVAEAIQALPMGEEQLSIHINVQDMELVRELAEQQGANWTLVADDQMEPGGCRVATKQSLVDYTSETRFQQTLETFFQQVAGQITEDEPIVDDSGASEVADEARFSEVGAAGTSGSVTGQEATSAQATPENLNPPKPPDDFHDNENHAD